MTAQNLLVTADVARLLRVHPKQVYRLMARGLPARRVGAEWRFVEADVLAWANGAARENAVVPTTEVARPATRPPLLAANGDVVVEVLLAALALGPHGSLGFVRADRTEALRALGERRVLFAAYHGGPPPMSLHDARIARIHLVKREVGLASVERLPRLGALPGKRLAGRPATAGIAGHLDRALEEHGLDRKRVAARTREFPSHAEAVFAVHRGEADVALTTAAWARRCGLEFLAIGEETYDLLLFAEDLGMPLVVATCEVVQSGAFRRAVGEHAGYDAATAGAIRYDFDAAPPRRR